MLIILIIYSFLKHGEWKIERERGKERDRERVRKGNTESLFFYTKPGTTVERDTRRERRRDRRKERKIDR